ncbi:translocator protein isoform X3 [Neomonachus schauinslandi]|uniref:Translocator protein n=1 Tax=Neomonachus schauinslandi TaxID=29088 RepID=A0A2Y9GW84_NEOSC|nr:translocator protein isoform X3 [Neomonachus schauinslandi]
MSFSLEEDATGPLLPPEEMGTFQSSRDRSSNGPNLGARRGLHPGAQPGGLPGLVLLRPRYGSYMVWKELGGFSEEAVVPLGLYAGQLALNWAWPPLFFGSRQMGWALVDLLLMGGLAGATAVAWHRVSPPAARLLYPYLAWLAFAATLNYCVWRDNQGWRGGRRLAE